MIRVVMQFSLNAEPWQEKSVTGGLYFSNKGPNLTVPSPLPIGKSIAGPEVQEYKAVPVEIELADQTVKVMNSNSKGYECISPSSSAGRVVLRKYSTEGVGTSTGRSAFLFRRRTYIPKIT